MVKDQETKERMVDDDCDINNEPSDNDNPSFETREFLILEFGSGKISLGSCSKDIIELSKIATKLKKELFDGNNNKPKPDYC